MALASDHIITRFEINGDLVSGFDNEGDEVARVPLSEPTMVRPAFDEERDVYRHNVT